MPTNGKTDGNTDRRDFIKYAGAAGASLSVAGCLGGGDDGDPSDDTGGDDTGDDNTGDDNTGDDDTDDDTDTGDEGGENLTITFSSAINGIGPHNLGGRNEQNAMLHFYETPIFRGVDGSFEPALATEWERIEDGRDRLFIREDVQFHNGDTLTPEDVAWTAKRLVDDDVYDAALGAFMGDIVDAEVVEDERAVDILSGPSQDSLSFNYLAFDSVADGMPVLNKEWTLERSPDQIQQEANGTGPYEVDNFESGVTLELTQFEDYWGGKEQPWETVTLNHATEGSTRVSRLQTGESDAIWNVPTQDVSRIEQEDGIGVVAGSTQRMIYIVMRTDKEPFSEVKFRKALNYAVDQDDIVENVLDGFGAKYNQHSIPRFDGYNEELPEIPHDPERAAELVEEAGQAGADLNIKIGQGSYLKGVETTQAVADQIDQLPNVSCTAEPVDGSSLNTGDRDLTTNSDMSVVGIGVIVPDSIRTFEFGLRKGYGLWDKGEEFGIQQRYEEARQLKSKEERIPIYKDINERVQEAWPFVYLNIMAAIFGVSSDVEWESRFDSRFVYAFEMFPQ